MIETIADAVAALNERGHRAHGDERALVVALRLPGAVWELPAIELAPERLLLVVPGEEGRWSAHEMRRHGLLEGTPPIELPTLDAMVAWLLAYVRA